MNDLQTNSVRAQYLRRDRRKILALVIISVITFFVGLWFMTLGVSETSFSTVFAAFRAFFRGELNSNLPDAAKYKIILFLRLPRLVIALVAGIGLSIAGVCMQGITRNPLVSPFTVGISSASAFGASIAIVFLGVTSLGSSGQLTIVLCAFLSALLCAGLVYLVTSAVGMNPESMVLIGTALNYLFSAGSSTLQFFADEHQLSDVVNWTFGSFNGIGWSEVGIVTIFVVVCSIFLQRFAMNLNVMASGEDETVRGLGLNPAFIRGVVGLLSILMTAAIISFTGVIGFVGLTGPHIARILVGSDHRFLIPFSGLIGAILLMVSDTIGKIILAPVTIPVGIVVSFLGVPLFLNLILTQKKGYLR